MRKKELKFQCPNCGRVSGEEVAFLCNTCREEDLIEKDGLFVCPQCFTEGQNFECMNCQSKDVKAVPPLAAPESVKIKE